MFLLKSLIDGPSSTFGQTSDSSKTVDATHPSEVLGQVTERFRGAIKTKAERDANPTYQFDHKERKDNVANRIRRQRQVHDGVVFIDGAQEKTQAFSGKKVGGQFEFIRACISNTRTAT
jgi:hypothetical protein